MRGYGLPAGVCHCRMCGPLMASRSVEKRRSSSLIQEGLRDTEYEVSFNEIAASYLIDVTVIIEQETPTRWAAHCLDFDIVSQGDGPLDAFLDVYEALTVWLEDDLVRGFDPTERRPAPSEYWV